MAQIEAMFRVAFDRRLAPGLSPDKGVRAGLSLRLVPSLWLRGRLPAWLRGPAPGLDVYQWIGLAVALAGCGMASWLGLRVLERIAWHALCRGGFVLDRAVVAPKLRPLAFQLGLWCLYLQIRLLDLPTAVVGVAIPAIKFAWIGLMGWTAFRLIDLGMILYGQSERLHDRRSLSDMIVPTAANGLKLAVLLVAVSCQVYLIGSRETLTQLLAGLGLIGLAASLAAQDTLKNFFGTLLLIGEHPFRIGEHIAVQGTEGVVESVGFRSTRLRTFEDSLLTIPNSVMAAALIDNRGRQDLPALPHRRLAGLRDADRQGRRAARRPEGVRGGPATVPPGQGRGPHRRPGRERRGAARAGLLPGGEHQRRTGLLRPAEPGDPRAGRAAGDRCGPRGPDGPPGLPRHGTAPGSSAPQARRSRTIGSTSARPPRRRRAAGQTQLIIAAAPSEPPRQVATIRPPLEWH